MYGHRFVESIRILDQLLLLLYSIPYLVDFISGVVSVMLLIALWEDVEDPQPSAPLLGAGDDRCVICLEKAQTILVYPCGHKCLCSDCSLGYIRNYSVCPICRNTVGDMVHVYPV